MCDVFELLIHELREKGVWFLHCQIAYVSIWDMQLNPVHRLLVESDQLPKKIIKKNALQ